jgi:hypothetical protein
LVQNQGGREVQPGGILLYFEDLNRAPNAEFGPKDFFEMGSCENKRCSYQADQAYELAVPSESIMDEKNIATFFCPHCSQELTCKGCRTAA